MSVNSKKSVVPMKSVSPSKSVPAEKRPSGRRTYTSQFKREAVELVEREGLSVAEAARRLGMDQTLLRSWRVKFQEQGDQAFPGAGQRTAVEEENRQLREENARLKMERDILKKATAFFARESR
jgi:transposase